MRWLENVKVAGKFLIMVGIAVVSLSALGITGYYYLSEAKDAMDSLYADRLLPVKWLNEDRDLIRTVQYKVLALMLANDKNEIAALNVEIAESAELFNKNIDKYEQTKLDQFEVDKLKELKNNLAKYREKRQDAMDLVKQNKKEEAGRLYRQSVTVYGEILHNNLNELAEYNAKVADELNQQNQKNYENAFHIYVSILVVGFLLVIIVSWSIAKDVALTLNTFVRRLELMAAGDFSQDIIPSFIRRQDEFGLIAFSFNQLNTNMRFTSRQISSTSEQLEFSAKGLAATSEQSAQTSDQVADSIVEGARGTEKQIVATEASSTLKKFLQEYSKFRQMLTRWPPWQ